MIYFLTLWLCAGLVSAQELPLIKATKINSKDYRFQASPEKYQASEEWQIWSVPFKNPSASSSLPTQGTNTYGASNLNDKNLKTAWVENNKDYGIGEKIEFTFNYEENEKYGTAYQFFGVINVFNGYCKSVAAWSDNSRVKKFKVYYNDEAVCYVELVDTWHLQEFDIAKFFRNSYSNQYMDVTREIKEGDKLSFEIVEVYKGKKYKDVALTEFLIEGARN